METSAKLLNNVKTKFDNIHGQRDLNPVLVLDKFAGPLNQENAKKFFKENLLPLNVRPIDISKRYEILKNLPGFQSKYFITQTSFTIHLSRSNVLENAGICFHPTYACVYIPGSGIKGLARAYAKQVWYKARGEKEEDKNKIIEIFGNDSDEKEYSKLTAGKIVFHDAFPVSNYQLELNINNCHHQQYYEGKGEPGDWENPNPTYFLAVKPNTTFRFALSLRQGLQKDENLLELAWEFLAGGLAHMGLGAKTAAGFGYFKDIKTESERIELGNLGIKKYIIELTSPAFLAKTELEKEYNNSQNPPRHQQELVSEPSECDLTANTLRGELRWWWRTIYASMYDLDYLRLIESIIWGSTTNESAVRIIVKKVNNTSPELLDFKKMVLKTKRDGTKKIELVYDKDNININNNICQISYRKSDNKEVYVTPLFYLFYGMDEIVKGKRKRRYYMPEGAQWEVKFICKDAYYPVKKENKTEFIKVLSKDEVLKEVEKALYLLEKYGGVGAKSSKGFGSIKLSEQINFQENKLIEEITLENDAKEKLNIKTNTSNNILSYPSLKHTKTKVICFNSANLSVWKILNKIGESYFNICINKYKHNTQKRVLGLPRKIINNQNYTPADANTKVNLYAQQAKISLNEVRLSSPIKISIKKDGSGYKLNIIGFKELAVTNNQQELEIIDDFINSF